jgi:hypothetical protein
MVYYTVQACPSCNKRVWRGVHWTMFIVMFIRNMQRDQIALLAWSAAASSCTRTVVCCSCYLFLACQQAGSSFGKES